MLSKYLDLDREARICYHTAQEGYEDEQNL